MQELINYCLVEPVPEDTYEFLAQFLAQQGLNGVELFIYEQKKRRTIRPYVRGVHLNYWPYWLDFWLNDTKGLENNFKDIQAQFRCYWGAAEKNTWLNALRRHIESALSEQPEYLVWHVANADIAECFDFRFRYSDSAVCQATAEVFNAVADSIPDNVAVLFENLWWPGLRLTEPVVVGEFFAAIEKKNVGIMLDVGHLLNTNTAIRSEAAGYAYVQEILAQLGAYRTLIRGVHLNCSLSGEYIQSCMSKNSPHGTSLSEIFAHVSQIDEHRPCTDPGIASVVDLIRPEYLVHELRYDNLADLTTLLNVQRSALGFIKNKV